MVSERQSYALNHSRQSQFGEAEVRRLLDSPIR